MSSRRRTRNIVLTSVFAAALAGLGVSLASATTTRATWTVHPGGSASASGGTISLKDTSSGSTITCSSAAGSGTLKSGSGLSGTGIASVSSASFTNCDGPFGIIIETRIVIPPHINAGSYNSSTGVTTGNVSGIHMTGTSTSCSFVVDGTSATANNGSVNGTYTNSTGRGTAISGGNLHFWNVSGCFGLFKNADPGQVSGSYIASPRQTITSP